MIIVETLTVFAFIASPCMTFRTPITGDLHSYGGRPESALVVTGVDISLQTAIRASQTVTSPTISLREINDGSRAYLVMRGAIPFSMPV